MEYDNVYVFSLILGSLSIFTLFVKGFVVQWELTVEGVRLVY